MSADASERTTAPVSREGGLRVLFAIGVLPPFYEAADETAQAVKDAIAAAYSDLGDRFGVTVVGTFDDLDLSVGPSPSWPWTSYILADAPDFETVREICNLVRTTRVGGDRLWKYIKLEARIGTRLFFANE
jgi:hypothetical protein